MVEIVNRMDYKVDVDGVVGTYHANMLKQYVERKTVTSHCLLSSEANVQSIRKLILKNLVSTIARSRRQNSHNHIMTLVCLTH